MKYKAKLELDLTSSDFLETELREACRAYAKSVAREEIDREIKEEIVEGVNARVDNMFTKRWGQTDIERLIKDTVAKNIEERMSRGDITSVVQKCTEDAIAAHRKNFKEYVAAEFKSELQGGYITSLIRDEVRREIPNAVLETLRAKS